AKERYKNPSAEQLAAGPAALLVDFKYDVGGIGKGGTVSLFVNDQKVGEGRMDKSVASRCGSETFEVGMDNGSPVSDSYRPPFAYAGTIKKVEIHLGASNLSASDYKEARIAERKAAMAIE